MRIGVFFAFLNDSYQRDLWRHLVRLGRERGIGIVGFCGHGLGAPVMAQTTMNLAYRMADPRSLDGLIVFSNTLGTFHGPGVVARLLEGRSLPTVSLGFDLDPIPSVSARGADDLAGLVRHLIRVHGRRRLALVSGPLGHLESQAREEAFNRVLATEGLSLDPALHFRGNFYTEAGRRAVEAFLSSGSAFDAVVCLNDHMAMGALEALRGHGVAVPKDVSLTGFDDIEEAASVSPPLTTVRQPLGTLATAALDNAVELIEGRTAGSLAFPCQPVYRQSCGCPPALPLDAAHPVSDDPHWEEIREAAERSDASHVLEILNRALAGQWGRTEALRQWRSLIVRQPQTRDQRPGWADQALAWLAEEEVRWEREARMIREEREQLVREHSVRLLGLLKLDAIVRYGEDHFPSLGISRSYFVLFDGPPTAPEADPPSRARWLTSGADRRLVEVGFDTALLVPPQEGFEWGPLAWLVEPLVYQDEALGYLLLEWGGADVDFEALRETLSTAIKGALLMEEVRHHQETLARQVRDRTRELREAHRDLQEVSNRTMQTIGQDIHDDLCQHLVGISMLASVVEETLVTTGTVAPGAVREIRGLVDSAVLRSRQFARSLYPPGLEEHGLVSALEDLVDSVGRPKGAVNLTFEGDCRVPDPAVALQVYRIVQESLTNALRHSGSEVVLVRLVRSDQGLLAEVRDFGRGLAAGAVGSGMGTRIVRDRAESIGAQLEIYNLDPGVCVSCFLGVGRT